MTVQLSNLTADIYISFAGSFFRKDVVDQPAVSEPLGKVVCKQEIPRGPLQLLSMIVVLMLCLYQMGTTHC